MLTHKGQRSLTENSKTPERQPCQPDARWELAVLVVAYEVEPFFDSKDPDEDLSQFGRGFYSVRDCDW